MTKMLAGGETDSSELENPGLDTYTWKQYHDHQ